eukprot:932388_1
MASISPHLLANYFSYWHYYSLIVAGIATTSILATSLVAFTSFCGKYTTHSQTDPMLTNALLDESQEGTNQTEYVQQVRFVMKSYKIAFFCCSWLLVTNSVVSLASSQYCQNNLLQQVFVSTSLLLIGSLCVHVVMYMILTLDLLWATANNNQNEQAGCRKVALGFLVSLCVCIDWILMLAVAYLLNSIVKVDDDILSRLDAEIMTGDDIIQMMDQELKQSNDDTYAQSLVMITIAIVSHFVIWIVIDSIFGVRNGLMPCVDEPECADDVTA